MMFKVKWLMMVMIALGISACAEHITESRFPDGPPATPKVPGSIQAIFTQNCAVSLCHNGIQIPNLTSDVAYNSIVSISSSQGLNYIEPGDPDQSYLYLKITGDSRIVGARMPQGQAPLSNSDIAAIRTWIENGAPAE